METEKNIASSVNADPDRNEVVLKNTFSDHGNEIEEIISRKPPFLVRWGISVLFLISLALLGISWFIKYPDIVVASATLNSINAPKEVVVQVNGKLVKLFASEGKTVKANEVLGYMESTASHDEVILLSTLLDSVNGLVARNQTGEIPGVLSVSMNNLGELQAAYQTFAQAFSAFSNYLNNGFYLRKRSMLNNDMNYLHRLHSTLLEQKNLLQQDLSLTDTTFKAQQLLKQEKVISAMDYRNEKSKMLAKEMTIPQITSSIITNESQQNEKQKEIAELENQIRQQKEVFVQALNTLKSYVDDWKRKYLLLAPAGGTVGFSTFLQENQQLKQGQMVCLINPGNTDYYVEALIAQHNFGKVKTGQDVLLKFRAYPFQEFGSVKGKVAFISNVPSDSGYLAKITLPEGLITNYKKIIQYRTGLSIQSDIITNNRRLLERFFSTFKSKLN